MYRGIFVLYKETLADSGVSMRFVGLDAEEATPILQSIAQSVPSGARHIATYTNADQLTDLLIAGEKLLWLSAPIFTALGESLIMHVCGRAEFVS